MTKIADIYSLIDKFAPFNTQMSFDNAGLLVGNQNDEVAGIAISLDATAETVLNAKKNGCNLLITHHPVIFGSLKSLNDLDVAYLAAKSGVCIISAHTNLDAANGGVNDALCQALGLIDISPLSNSEDIVPLARIGMLRTKSIITAQSYAQAVKESIDCGCVKLTASDKNINTVAVCGGAGGDYIIAAKNAGADALITGECKHHERLLAKQIGLSLLECGHFSTEQLVKSKLYNLIKPVFDKTIMLEETDPAIYI